MRRLILLPLFFISCGNWVEKEEVVLDLIGDRSAYIEYRLMDLEGDSLPYPDEQVYELEWFLTLTTDDQKRLIDSFPSFDHLSHYIEHE